MTDSLASTPIDESPAGGAAAAPAPAPALRTRVVREPRRETWFVVNEGAHDLDVIPVDLRDDGSLRRVDINGEVCQFRTEGQRVLVEPLRVLRAGAGTIVVLHFR